VIQRGTARDDADRALAAAGYEDLRAEQAKRRASGEEVQLGIGLSCYVEITGAGGEAGGAKENATVEVHPDGSATILTGTSPHGQGHQTVWAMLASEELGIPVDRITLKWGDTDLIPEGGGTGGSRSLQQGGAAVQQASRDLLDVAEIARKKGATLIASYGDDTTALLFYYTHTHPVPSVLSAKYFVVDDGKITEMKSLFDKSVFAEAQAASA